MVPHTDGISTDRYNVSLILVTLYTHGLLDIQSGDL